MGGKNQLGDFRLGVQRFATRGQRPLSPRIKVDNFFRSILWSVGWLPADERLPSASVSHSFEFIQVLFILKCPKQLAFFDSIGRSTRHEQKKKTP